MDNNHSQGKETSNEVLLIVDEISDFLARDFKRYENLFKDFYALPHFFFSYDEFISPKFMLKKI